MQYSSIKELLFIGGFLQRQNGAAGYRHQNNTVKTGFTKPILTSSPLASTDRTLAKVQAE